MQFVRANQKSFAETAVDHDADDIQCAATVPLTSTTRKTLAAVHVGFDTASIACCNVGDAVANRQDFDSQFMTGNAWILKERKLAQPAAQICAANAHPMCSHKYLPRTRLTRVCDVDVLEILWFFEANGFHGIYS